eukprot:3409978-Amphidinium_carterae.2
MAGEQQHSCIWLCKKCGRYTAKRLTMLARACAPEHTSTQQLQRVKQKRHPAGSAKTRNLKLTWVRDIPIEALSAQEVVHDDAGRPSWAV